ncbi:MAG: hypothetical protein HKN10_04985 [Myxococcales bacterium]|nr:hypothetical protein [Deltaproteobacteria bacterium]NNE17816.1 hypothetical protein [Myxococcales bacterium]
MRFFVLIALVLAQPQPAAAYDNADFIAPENEALVVFIQNLYEDRAERFIVFDADKQCVAEVGGRQAEAVPMKPGKYTFFIASFKNQRIDIEIAAGRTYFIRLNSIAKVSNRATEVTLVQRRTESFKLVKTWLQGARVTHGRDDPCRGKPLKERQNRIIRRINDANSAWKRGDEIYRYRYRLLEDDGLTAAEVGWL